jgi:hypothetical protein
LEYKLYQKNKELESEAPLHKHNLTVRIKLPPACELKIALIDSMYFSLFN